MAAKAFRFSLQTVFDLRNREVDQAQQALQAEELKLNKTQAEMERLSNCAKEAFEDFHNLTPDAWQMDYHGYIQQIRNGQANSQNLMNLQQTVVEKHKALVREARMKAKTLEKLFEKQQKAHTAMLLKEEEIFLNEIATQRYYLQQQAS
ncbi:MAG: flagellar export protein FliJ [Candidatus Melainabacteria bacterium]|nr:flagellar export protein FliJ [Candidatus Melainabacteria bacterium]